MLLEHCVKAVTLSPMPNVLINVDVPDIQAGIAFYSAAFGFRLSRRLGPDFVELAGGQAPIYLLKNDAGTFPSKQAPETRRYLRHWTPVHLDIVVGDLELALATALAAGAIQESAPSAHVYGRLVLLSDPFGHGICLLQFSAKGYDAIATRA